MELCFFKDNFLELKSNLKKDGENGIFRYFDINRREKVFAWIFFFLFFFYVIAVYRIAKYRNTRVEGMGRFLSRVAIRGKKESGKVYTSYRVEPLLSFVDALEGSFYSDCFETIIVRRASKLKQV